MNTDEIKYPFFNKTGAKFPFLPTISHFIRRPFIFKPQPALRTSTPLFSPFPPFPFSLLLSLTFLFPFSLCFPTSASTSRHYFFPSHPYSLFLPAFGNSKTNSNNSTNSDIRSRTNARFPARSRSSRCCIYHADSPFLIFTKIVVVVFTFNIRHANSLLLIFFTNNSYSLYILYLLCQKLSKSESSRLSITS